MIEEEILLFLKNNTGKKKVMSWIQHLGYEITPGLDSEDLMLYVDTLREIEPQLNQKIEYELMQHYKKLDTICLKVEKRGYATPEEQNMITTYWPTWKKKKNFK